MEDDEVKAKEEMRRGEKAGGAVMSNWIKNTVESSDSDPVFGLLGSGSVRICRDPKKTIEDPVPDP